jgi:hypothetical protein
VWLVPELAFEAEVLLDGKLSGAIVDSYATRTDYTAESRDIVVGGQLSRFRPRGGSHLEFTAGGGVAFSRFARRDIVSTSVFPPGGTAAVARPGDAPPRNRRCSGSRWRWRFRCRRGCSSCRRWARAGSGASSTPTPGTSAWAATWSFVSAALRLAP